MPAATVAHPLGPPVVSGTTITVDTMLNQATRVTRMIMDLTLQRFIADRVFASAGGVTGGAVVYDQALLNELYTDRDVQRVPPGGEFPIITSSRQAPTQLMRLQIIYGDRLQAVLGSFNARIYTSNRVAVGVAYVVAEQQVGELRMEKPLGTTTWREDATERTWVQSSVRPIMYVTNPFSVIKVTGLGA
jgi:hypothetical protein